MMSKMKLLALLISFFLFSSHSLAEDQNSADCVDCGGELSSSVKPDISVAMNLKKDLATPTSVSKGLSSEKPVEVVVKPYLVECKGKGEGCYKMVMCNKFFLTKDRYDVEELFELIPTMPEFNKVDDYFFMVECSVMEYSQGKSNKAPLIHYIVDDIGKRLEYLEAIFDMYELKGEGFKLTQILNLKNSNQDTFLDYLFLKMTNYRTAMGEESKVYYEKIFKYACEKGAEFSKYKGKAKCGMLLYRQLDN